MFNTADIKTQGPFVLVIFGATGDLARNKLIPALFSLYKKGELGKNFFVIGFARRDLSDLEFCSLFESSFSKAKDKAIWKNFSKNLYYQQGFFDQNDGYNNLISKLHTFDDIAKACLTRVFYLATPPDNYETILYFLQDTRLAQGCKSHAVDKKADARSFVRLAIEKPFGKDLETARELDRKLVDIFEEKQIFRVDHYLGKETVQNMLAFRFANGIFEPVWNKEYIDHVQITWGEKQGISGRGRFFDGVGLLRDVGQNHLMQLLATIVMEQPQTFSKEDIRDARFRAIEAISPVVPKDVSKFVVRGQYIGYGREKDVAKGSATETFIAMKLSVDTPRFFGVPFYLRAGKKVDRNEVKISLVFRQTCHILFKEFGCPEEGNVLTIHVQPDEGIGMRVVAKAPGSKLSLKTVDMKFTYKDEFGGEVADAYEKILLDIFHGDQMLFNRSDELESSWDFITQILKGWSQNPKDLYIYKSGVWGPQEASDLIEKDGRKWL